ncbi:MAG: patatin-like phospholipase family protein [Acidobacteriota bacterium]
MPSRTCFLAALAVLLGLTVGGFSGLQASEDCRPLRLGLPYDARSGEVQDEVLAILAEAWRPNDRCPRRVQVALGSPYHLLDWFHRSSLDLALLQDPAIALLLKDHPERPLQEVVVPPERATRLHSSASPVYWQATSSAASSTPPKRDDFFASSVRQARADAERQRKEECSGGNPAIREALEPGDGYQVVASWHLDPGYLALLFRFEEWWRKHGPEDVPKDLVWRVLLRRSRFRSPSRVAAAAANGTVARPTSLEPVLIRDPIRRRLIAHPQEIASRLRPQALQPAHGSLPPGIRDLIESPPEPFRPSIEITPAFGARTFSFTLGESMDLLRGSQNRRLALVLPGGGVKAAYQSRLVDALYGEHWIHNSESRPLNGNSLPVDTVVGTSGGALLGYFVARLSEHSSFDLATLLWNVPETSRRCARSDEAKSQPDGTPRPGQQNAAEIRTLRSGDIFPGGDFLRYASVLVAFLILSAVLWLAAFPRKSPLHAHPIHPDRPPGRRRLTFGAAWFLFVIPLLVKAIHGPELAEHIPEIEGLVYALATFLAVTADQILVRLEGDPENPPPVHPAGVWRIPAVFLAVGTVIGGIPFLVRIESLKINHQWLDAPAPFALAASLLYGLFLAVGWWMMRGRRRFTKGQIALLVSGIVAAPIVMLVTSRFWIAAFELLGEAALFFLGFLLVALLLLLRELVPDRFEQPLAGGPVAGYLLLTSTVILSLTRPVGVCDLGPNLMAPSGLGLSIGALMVSLGSLVFFAGLIAVVFTSDRRYVIARRDDLFAGLAVAVGHILLVYLVLIGGAFVGGLSNLELTWGFWLRLIVVAFAWSVLLVTLGLFGRIPYLQRGLKFLASMHPNGALVKRRLLRVAGIAFLALVWWNLTVAPAIYGNRKARSYLEAAIARFDRQEAPRPARLNTRFLVPTNVLDQSEVGSESEPDGASESTYFFLFSPGEPALSPGDGSGARWLSYGTDFSGTASENPDILTDRELLEKVIMASGSPFPIFPATRIDGLPGNDETYWMIDGGFSSLVPVDAALNAENEQILIVHSTHPLGHPRAPSSFGGLLKKVPGNLTQNLGRLPAHLFGASQRVDQISRRESLVISLAPPQRRTPWPPLFDFRKRTVDCLIHWAEEDLDERIGLVESWGQPNFRAPVNLTPPAPPRTP